MAADLDKVKADMEKGQMQTEERVRAAMAEADAARKESSRKIGTAWDATKEANL